MFGFYDPSSLKVGERQAAIDFIDSTKGLLTQVEITSSEKARSIARCLKMQTRLGIASLQGELQELTGSLIFNPADPSEGMMRPQGESRIVPIKLDFEVEPDSLPRNSIARAVGVFVEGAFIVAKVAMKPLGPAPEPRPSQGVQHVN